MDDVAKNRSQLIEEAARMHHERIEIRSVGFELLQQQINFEHLIYQSSAAILTFHPDGTICSFSRGAEKLFGYEELDVTNHYANFLVPDANLQVDGLKSYLNGRKETCSQWESPIVARHADNSLLYLTADISEINGAQGFQEMLVVFQNITKQKIAEQESARYTANIENLVAELKDELRLSKESAANAGFAEKEAVAIVLNEFQQPLERVGCEIKKGLGVASSKKKYSALIRYFESIKQEVELLNEFIGSINYKV
jgi:PAS domain S-box-containing protein